MFTDLKPIFREQIKPHLEADQALWDLVDERENADACEDANEPQNAVEPKNAAGHKKVDKLKKTYEISDLVELTDHHLGRIAVARCALSEPLTDDFRMDPPRDPIRRPLPLRMPSVFRTLKAWSEAVAEFHPTHLDPLAPHGAAVVLGRLLAEGVIDLVLSTNWDAYAELGCLLVGIRVCDVDEDHKQPAGWRRELPRKLQVFEAPREAALCRRRQETPLLLKLHGGVRSVSDILESLQRGRISHAQAKEELQRSFLISSEDLVHWKETSQWVSDVVGDSLRTHNVLTLGLSGADPVIYRAFRRQIREWERERSLDEPGAPPLTATDYSPSLRLLNMLTVQEPGEPSRRVAQADGSRVLRCAYAWWLLNRLLRGLARQHEAEARLAERLSAQLRSEIGQDEKSSSPTPLCDVLSTMLGPNARWAAIAEGRAPFDRIWLGAQRPFRRWWYAPWSSGNDDASQGHVERELAALVALLASPGKNGAMIDIDAWTGVVHLPRGHILTGHHPAFRPEGKAHGDGHAANLLLLPWPWPARRGLGSQRLREELRSGFSWGPGRPLEFLARAPLWLVPVGDESGTGREGSCDLSFSVAGVRARVLRPALAQEIWERHGLPASPRTWMEMASCLFKI